MSNNSISSVKMRNQALINEMPEQIAQRYKEVQHPRKTTLDKFKFTAAGLGITGLGIGALGSIAELDLSVSLNRGKITKFLGKNRGKFYIGGLAALALGAGIGIYQQATKGKEVPREKLKEIPNLESTNPNPPALDEIA